MQHIWSEDDNLIIYCVYRFGEDCLSASKRELSEILGMSEGSIGYKIGNFKAIDGLGKLDGYSSQSAKIHSRFHALPDNQVITEGKKAYLRSIEKHMNALREELETKKVRPES